MATYTTKLNLKKPAGTDPVLIADINTNMDTLDHAQLQYSTMPIPAIGNLGWIVTFTGTTDANYTHGHVYECVSSGGGSPTYSWAEIQGVPTGGTTGQALVKSSATDYATEWAAVGRSNPNMLINRNFAVNQIGTAIGTAFAANGYITDCWQAWGGNVTLIDGGGVILASGVQLMQRFEIDYAKLFGKTYTLSLKIGGEIKTATIIFPSAVAGADVTNTLVVDGVGTVGFGFIYTGGTIINGINRLYVPCVYVVSSSTIQIDEAYLEPGRLSTLAYAPEMDYAQELLKCQRYYCSITLSGIIQTKTGTNVYLVSISYYPSGMRLPPSVFGGLSQTFQGAIPGVVALNATITDLYRDTIQPSEWRLTLSADVGSVGSIVVLYNVKFSAQL